MCAVVCVCVYVCVCVCVGVEEQRGRGRGIASKSLQYSYCVIVTLLRIGTSNIVNPSRVDMLNSGHFYLLHTCKSKSLNSGQKIANT